MKNLLLILLSVISLQFVNGQNCYDKISSLTGIDDSQYLSTLEEKSCTLKDSLPTEFQSDFKVYHFEFYKFAENFQGGIPTAINTELAKISQESQYFLFFAYEMSRNGGSPHLWVELKLPKTNSFSCLSDKDEFLIKEKLNLSLNEKDFSSFDLFDREIASIEYLTEKVSLIKECCEQNTECDFNLSATDRTKMLFDLGFVPLPIENAYEEPPSAKHKNSSSNRSGGLNIVDHGSGPNIIEIGGVTADISSNITNFFNDIEGFNNSVNIHITSNKNLYENDEFNQVKSEFSSDNSDFKVWFHIDEENNFLYVNDQSSITLDWGTGSTDTIPPTNAQELFYSPYQFAGDEPIIPQFDRPDYPNVFKRFWNYLQERWHITRALQFANYWDIPSNEIFFYNLPLEGSSTGFREFIIIYHHYIDPPSPPGGDYQNIKHIFRRHRSNVFWSYSNDNDSHWQKWDNLWDDEGIPILTDEDLKECMPGTGFNALEVIEFVGAEVGLAIAFKFAVKRIGKRMAARKVAAVGSGRLYKIYYFLESKGDYYGQTIQILTRRIAQHSKKGKEIVDKSVKVIAEISENIPHSKKITDGIEQLTLEWANIEKIANIKNVISKLKRPQYYKDAILKAENYLKNSSNPLNKEHYDLLKKTIDAIKETF